MVAAQVFSERVDPLGSVLIWITGVTGLFAGVLHR